MMKYFFILLLFISCGSRKVELQKHTIETNAIESDNSRILKQEYILSLIPFDSLKPMQIDGITYTNVIITSKKINTETTYDKKNITKTIEIIKTKSIQRNEWTSIIFVLCLFIFLWFYLKSFQK